MECHELYSISDRVCLYLSYSNCSDQKIYNVVFVLRLIEVEPLPKQKYGNGMVLFGPYLTHMWECYGKIRWQYGTGMEQNFTKFLTMGSVWEENLRLPILWENYGNKVPIHIP